MSKGVVLNRNGQRWMPAVYDALGASHDVKVALGGGFENLLRVVGADYGAVALAGPERDAVPDWVVQKHLPPAFLAAYVEMIEHDFLLTETLKRPNVVLRDHQMSTRRDFVRNPFVLRAREVGTPIHQVMAVSLIIEGVGLCGLALYRDRARPFTQREQRLLQETTPAFRNTVRNCREFGAVSGRNRLLETAVGALVFLTPSGKEIERTSAATTLFEAWFTPEERSGGGVPRPLQEMLLKAVAQQAQGSEVNWFWTRKDHSREVDLAVSLLHVASPDTWVMKLKEWGHLPSTWAAKLTKAERRVATKMILGWDSPLIAQELGTSARTVETQAQQIRDKLEMVDRKELIRRAMMES